MTNSTRIRWMSLPALLVAALTALTTGPAAADTDPAAPFLGVWNYDQPDRTTMTNIATMDIAGFPPTFPQIGTVVFSHGDNGEILGHTDQGCTWRFRIDGAAMELAATDQICFNHIIGSEYNIDRWRVETDGDHERETLHANSYQGGATFSFDLADGRRTRADAGRRADTVRAFTGTWQFDPADPATLINLALVTGAVPVPVPTPVTGSVEYRPGPGDTIVARTADGCDWTLDTHGNTAELAPGTPSCGGVTRTFWSVAADGDRQTTIMAGVRADGSHFSLTTGELTRQP
ncbi:hypothetical protein [Nocardia sp. alder85J]|uniref:hypothetical protein n=1 Tax=Nocardia sp. alder85J TaxID=2862949 RepID=UPI001CD7A105|nr:hypothetical protein [Nocardia sp. alder85J]MCX4098880.1 hypothetical protein [Nocardia sp. alder85J]